MEKKIKTCRKKVEGADLGEFLSCVEFMCVLHVLLWLRSRCSGFLPPAEHRTHIRAKRQLQIVVCLSA